VRSIEFLDDDDVRAAIRSAKAVVARGGTILMPTESYYGLGADPRQRAAVDRVFTLKARPTNLALPVVCCDWQQLEMLVDVPDAYRVRLSRIWPAALTVVARCRRRLPASAGNTLAVRIPGHDLLRALLYRVGPLTATSANRHGEPPCVDVSSALESLSGSPDLVLDGGTLAGGRVSTMVDLTTDGAPVIRAGSVAWEQRFDLQSSSVQNH
jgi:L-threonylcarbamoyladenylate synthase